MTAATDASKLIAKIKADLASKYKYTVAGKKDDLFAAVGKGISDAKELARLKSHRAATLNQLKAIEAAGGDENEQKAAKAQARLKFVEDAYRSLKIVNDSNKIKSISHPVTEIVKELSSAVQDYIDAKTALNGSLSAEDKAFIQKAKDLSAKVQRLFTDQKNLLVRVNHTVFNVEVYTTEKTLKATRSQLQSQLDILT